MKSLITDVHGRRKLYSNSLDFNSKTFALQIGGMLDVRNLVVTAKPRFGRDKAWHQVNVTDNISLKWVSLLLVGVT